MTSDNKRKRTASFDSYMQVQVQIQVQVPNSVSYISPRVPLLELSKLVLNDTESPMNIYEEEMTMEQMYLRNNQHDIEKLFLLNQRRHSK